MSDEAQQLKGALHAAFANAQKKGAVQWRRTKSTSIWRRSLEVGFFEVDQAKYTALRQRSVHEFLLRAVGKGSPVLVYTEAEWDAFTAGAKDGEFDL